MSNQIILSAEDLLAGAESTFDLVIPPELTPLSKTAMAEGAQQVIKIRPLSIGVFSLIMRAAKSDASLIPLFMVKEGVVEPALSLEQVKKMPIGLVEFIVENLREVSGLMKKKSP